MESRSGPGTYLAALLVIFAACSASSVPGPSDGVADSSAIPNVGDKADKKKAPDQGPAEDLRVNLPDTNVRDMGLVDLPNDMAVKDQGKDHEPVVDTGNQDLVITDTQPDSPPASDTTIVPGTWNLFTIDSVGAVGTDTSLAVDALDGVHISYHDLTNDDLKYAYRASAGSWTTTTVDAPGFVGSNTSIALDDSGGVHISYQDNGELDLKYAYKAPGATWSTTLVYSINSVFGATSIAVDGSGGVHVVFLNGHTSTFLKHAYKPGGASWFTGGSTIYPQVGEPSVYASIAVDKSNGVHVAYREAIFQNLEYAYKPSGGTWSTTTVDSTGSTGEFPSIAVDALNGVHISYHDSTNHDLKYAYKASGGNWVTAIADSPPTNLVGGHTSLAIDTVGAVHISYYDFTDFDLKYAHKEPGSGSWTTTTVDAAGVTGWHTSLGLDTSGGVHISYYDDTNDDLKYAFKPSLP